MQMPRKCSFQGSLTLYYRNCTTSSHQKYHSISNIKCLERCINVKCKNMKVRQFAMASLAFLDYMHTVHHKKSPCCCCRQKCGKCHIQRGSLDCSQKNKAMTAFSTLHQNATQTSTHRLVKVIKAVIKKPNKS